MQACLICTKPVNDTPEDISWNSPRLEYYAFHKLCATIALGVIYDPAAQLEPQLVSRLLHRARTFLAISGDEVINYC